MGGVRSPVLVAATVLIAVGALAGCSRTVDGQVAMTTEPGAPLTSTRSAPPSSGDAQSVTCGEFNAMSPDDQQAVIEEILSEFGPTIGGDDMNTMRIAADAMCQFLPKDIVLADVLMGGGPP